MAIRYHLVEPGMVLWQKRRQKMGNVRASRDAWYQVEILEKHETGCLVRWNGNPPRIMRRKDVEKLYRKNLTKEQP